MSKNKIWNAQRYICILEKDEVQKHRNLLKIQKRKTMPIPTTLHKKWTITGIY